MGLFGRKTAVDSSAPATATKTHHPRHTHGTRPTFGQWLKYTFLDILTMLVMGVIGLGVRALTKSASVNNTDDFSRFTLPNQLRQGHSRSCTKMVKLSILSLRTRYVAKSFLSGLQQ